MTVKKEEDVLGRMYNWKMDSAYEQARMINKFPKKALKLLKEMSETYGNCGWCDGKVFDILQETNNKIAHILGYVWDDDEDFWIKSKVKPKKSKVDILNTEPIRGIAREKGVTLILFGPELTKDILTSPQNSKKKVK